MSRQLVFSASEVPANRDMLRRGLPLLAFILCLVDGVYLKDMIVRTPDNDFSKPYFSTVAFLEGGDMYGINPSTASGESDGEAVQLWNLNPPHFHLILLPFAVLSIYLALALWMLINVLCLFFSLYAIRSELQLDEQQWSFVLVGTLAFVGTTSALLSGHCSFILMLLVTRMWLAGRQGRWTTAGLYLGVVMSVKPFLLMLLPYLVLRRRWKAAGAAVAMSLLCFALGVAVFGVDAHLAWREKLAASTSWCWQFANGSLYGMLARTLTANPMGESLVDWPPALVPLLWLGLGVPVGLITLAACVEKTPGDVDRSFSILLVAALLLSPLGWVYYFCLPLGPTAIVARNWWRSATPASRWSRGLLLVAGCALVCPLSLCRLFQPSALATISLGNLYSYCILAIWLALVLDALRSFRSLEMTRMSPQLNILNPGDYRVSVVMPVYSETDTVRPIAEWLIRELGPRLQEILIIQSPRSCERSRAVCRELTDDYPQIQVHMQRNNPGLGWAVREGFALATGNLLLTIDSDGEMEIETVPRMLDEMARGGHALVAASRWLPGGGFSGYSRMKYRLNWCFQQLFRWLFWTPLHDLTYGFKLIRAELVRGLDWQGTLHEIACETTLKIVRLGVSVAEVPSKWTARTQGASKNTFWRNFRYVRTAAGILLRGVAFTPRAVPFVRQTSLSEPAPNDPTPAVCGMR